MEKRFRRAGWERHHKNCYGFWMMFKGKSFLVHDERPCRRNAPAPYIEPDDLIVLGVA